MPEYTSGSSIRAEETPPKKSISRKQMVDFRGFPLSTEEGNPLTTDKESYPKVEYGSQKAPSVVLNSESYLKEGVSSANQFSKTNPAALPVIEQFAETSEVSRTLLGINRETTQQGLFGNVSTYGLDEKDWRVDGTENREPEFWYARPSSSGQYFETKFEEDTTNSALVISVYPSPFTPPPKPELQDQLLSPGGAERYRGWGQYINSIIAQYLVEYMVKNFTNDQLVEFNLTYLLTKYPPKVLSDGSLEFNQLYWDKIWLDIQQNRFGAQTDYPIIPTGRAVNFVPTDDDLLNLTPFKSASLWGQRDSQYPNGNPNVIITEADAAVANTINCAWDSFFFSTTRVFYPEGTTEDQGHYRIRTNPTPEVWNKYFGLDWEYIRQDLKDWSFTIHESPSTVTDLEEQLKLPYFILSNPLVANPSSIFSSAWPNQQFGSSINLPTTENKIGGSTGVNSEITIKSIRAFRYQPGRISGFTYGSKASEIGAGPGTTIEWGVENDTDGYFFRLRDGADFTIVRRSIIPLEETVFLEDSGYAENTREIFVNGRRQYETIIEQKQMNGDPLNGEGDSGYILNPDTVTMYKIEFGWYGAIGARFYAYIPEKNGECRWVSVHTLVIENQLGQPCLGDPFFYFKYRLKVSDSSTIRVDQFLYKFGASYYIDGYDKGTLYSSFANSKKRELKDPKFSQSKTLLNAIDWTVLMGIKPKQYLYNRYGNEIYNKKEIFPKSFSIFSQEDCEIKIIRQKACPEFAYTHQEGYNWGLLPESRRLKAKFSVNNFNINQPSLVITEDDGDSHTATLNYAGPATGDWRDPTDSNNYDVIGQELIKVVGDDLFQLTVTTKALNGVNSAYKLQRIEQGGYFSSRDPDPELNNVYLPFTYAPVGEYANGYEVEFDYYRRDQILLSNIDVISDEFYIFWTGGYRSGIDETHASNIRIGFIWPDVSGNTSSLIHQSKPKDVWGIESPPTINDYIEYDGQKFYEGIPVDFTQDYPNNTLYVETNSELEVNTYNLEVYEFDDIQDFWELNSENLNVPGIEGGVCNGLGCKAGREVREAEIVVYNEDLGDGNFADIYYLQDTSPWPSLGQNYSVTIDQGANTTSVSVGTPTQKRVGDAVVYLLSLGQSLPSGLTLGDVEVSYNIIYIATIDRQSKVRDIITAKIAPGNIPFIRVFAQARQGCSMGGMWIGQKTPNGIILDPFTPHRSTVNIKDSGSESHGENFASPNEKTDGSIKVINTYTQIDPLGKSTAPTTDPTFGTDLDSNKSFHTNPRKCGSFLSEGGTNAAGILTAGQYPIRWLTSPSSGLPLGSFYVSKNQSVEISLEDIFNVDAESVVNSDDANLATIFLARSLNNHDPVDSEKEIYMTLNYDEQ